MKLALIFSNQKYKEVLKNSHNNVENFADLAKEYGYTVYIGRDLESTECERIKKALLKLKGDFGLF